MPWFIGRGRGNSNDGRFTWRCFEANEQSFVLKVNNERLQDFAWFKAINDQLENGRYAAMLHDLLHHDLGDFHPRELPKCNDLASQQALSLGPFDSWWVELLETGTLTGCDPKAPHRAVSNRYEIKVVSYTERWVTRLGLYDQARTTEPRLRNVSEHKFGDFLTEQGCDNSRKVMRRRGWTFPELPECRKTVAPKHSFRCGAGRALRRNEGKGYGYIVRAGWHVDTRQSGRGGPNSDTSEH